MVSALSIMLVDGSAGGSDEAQDDNKIAIRLMPIILIAKNWFFDNGVRYYNFGKREIGV